MNLAPMVMVMVDYNIIAVIIVCFLFLLSFFGRNKGQPWNFPLIGMLHLAFPVSKNIFESLTKVLEKNKGTFVYRGPWFSGRDMIVTCDPANYQHILSSKFSNYPKGSDTYKLFEPYGEFLFSLDFEEWRNHRKIVHGVFSDQRVQNSHPKVHSEIFKNGLIPVLDHACDHDQAMVLDLKVVFRRLFLDITIMSATGYNHGSLNIDFPEEPVLEAIYNVNRGILFRHVLPERIWKFQRWLGIGQEKKVIEASKIIEELISKYDLQKNKEEGNFISTTSLLPSSSSSEEYLKREFIKASLFASVDTTGVALTWFFWLIQENPTVEIKIRQEIETKLLSNNNNNNNCNNRSENLLFVDPGQLNKLVYLHAAILEALRLYPSVPFQSRTCAQTDILPSGHRIESGMKVTFALYATARMKFIWGEDCCEYKPERWISISTDRNRESRILPVSSTKFCSFISGSRICSGKELVMLRLKSVVATVLHNYDIQLLKDYQITPSTEIVLEMKYPLNAKIKKR